MLEGDDCSRKLQESAMDCCDTVVSDQQAPKLVEPGDGALDDPTVPTESLAGLDASPCDARRHPLAAHHLAIGPGIIALVSVDLDEPASRSPGASALQRRYGVQHPLQRRAVVRIRRTHLDREGRTPRVGDDVVLRPRPPAVRRAPACLFAPPGARIVELSTTPRPQSMAPWTFMWARTSR